MPSSSPSLFGLYGAGGFAREVMPLVRDKASTYKAEIYFLETSPLGPRTINGTPLISENEFFQLPHATKYFNIAIADTKARERLAKDCLARGGVPLSLHAPNATIYDANEIGEGAILCAQVTITSNTKIGRFFHANLYAYVGHDCVIGDFVTFAPRVSCNGNVHIGNHATIGTGAILRHGLSGKPLMIGEGAVVGMGAVVTKDVPPFTTVIGNPARVMET